MAAFLSKPGFKPVKHLTGAPYNGQANMYVVGAAVTLVPGDVVIAEGTGHASGVPTCTIATAAAVPLGVVIGVVNAKFDPVTGKMTTGTVSLDTPQTATQGSFVLVADAPDLVCETEIASYVQADTGRNAQMVVTTYNTTTGASNMKCGASTATQTDPLKILGRVLRMDGTATGTYTDAADGDTNVKILVAFNTHAYKAATGTAVV